MAFLSPLGLGARLIRRRRRRPCSSRVVKAKVVKNTVKPHGRKIKHFQGFELKPHGQKRKHLEVEVTQDKKVRGNFSSRSSISNFSDCEEDIVFREILSWLPVKSLMRFKTVCKNWLFLIEVDTSFMYLHHERSRARPGLLISKFTEDNNKYQLISGDLFGSRKGGAISSANVHTAREVDFANCDLMLQPVNGLTALFGERRSDPGVCIVNLSTREVTPWIESKLLGDVRKKDLAASKYFPMANCTLGYDPTSKEHKVVGIWRSSSPSYKVCEVLTVGDNEWRQIEEVPPHSLELHGSSVHINGSIYYTTELLRVGEAGEEDESKFIVEFDVAKEKFRSIRVPSYIFAQPDNEDSGLYLYSIMLLEFDGRLGLFIAVETSDFPPPKLWVLDEDGKKKNSKGSWTEVQFQLPYTLDGGRCGVALNPVSGTRQMILTSYLEAPDGKIDGSTCHSYNWEKKTFNEIEFSGILSVPSFSSASRVATFFESLFPVRKCRGSSEVGELMS